MTICSNRLLLFLAGSLWIVAGCASNPSTMEHWPRVGWALEGQAGPGAAAAGWAVEERKDDRKGAYWAGPRIAVLPVYNLTGVPVSGAELTDRITGSIKRNGISILKKEILNEFMTKHRMRYTGGVDGRTALALKNETGVEDVLITTLESYDENDPPRISLHSRLVSTGSHPEVLWSDSVCRAGEDSPGLLDLGVIHDPEDLMTEAVDRLASSMVLAVAGKSAEAGDPLPAKGIKPRDIFRLPGWSPRDASTVAVLPFLNLSGRPKAGEILHLYFADRIGRSAQLKVVEPGEVRMELLKRRITMQGGLSIPHLELLLSDIDADLVLTGTVFEYEDGLRSREPRVEFSVQIFERESKRVVWSSRNVEAGGDHAHFFDIGRKYTACELTADLAWANLDKIIFQGGNTLH